MIRIGINGFGRIGRLVFRNSLNNHNINVVGINDLFDTDYITYLLKYDSTHGKLNNKISFNKNILTVDNKKIRISNFKDPSLINWGNLDVDFVVESTGLFLTNDLASKHIEAGAKNVIISAPVKDNTPMFVYGVNHNSYDPKMKVISNASCTTNCLAPISKVIHDNFKIKNGLMTTVHAVTSSQNVLDIKSTKNWRLGRGAYQNIIPSSTGAAKALGKVIPELDGKITGMSFRVPIPNVSVVDLSFNTEINTSFTEICQSIKYASENNFNNIIRYSEDSLVSSDILSDPHTSVFDAKSGLEISKNFFKIIAWYDNEYAYSSKILDMINHAMRVINN